ncbi:IclR family transcriptional regulator [Bremerella sp. JC770]|uniref:IclR family transcriptional regulator n=1 Tax=Bremerella sp. JC770 TaxID=3232137 RepID=UPI00345B0FE7
MESTTVVKAFALLESIAAGSPDGLRLSELAEAVDMAKPTAHRLIKTLVGLGYVDAPGGGIYRLGSRASLLAGGTGDAELLRLAEPLLSQLNEKLDETINLGVMRNSRVVYLRSIESKQALRHVVSGEEDPFYCTALGRAIASHLPEVERNRLVQVTKLSARTDKTITSTAQLQKVLAQAAELGYAIESDETDIGVTCIGVPVFAKKQVVGAISLTAPSLRLPEARQGDVVRQLKTAARKLSKLLSSP